MFKVYLAKFVIPKNVVNRKFKLNFLLTTFLGDNIFNWRKSQNTFNKSVQYHFNLQILLPKTLKSWKRRFGLKKVAKWFQTKKWLRRQVRRRQSNPRKQEVIPATDFEYFQYFVMLKKVASSEDKMKINSELLLSCKLIFWQKTS